MAETKLRIKTTKTVTSSVRFTQDEIESILRAYVGAPAGAEVDIDIGGDGWLRDVTVTWSVTEESVETPNNG